MNLLYLKYAVEVEKTKSITKAAENLFMGQPNLSRAIKELEETLGIRVFKRTSMGVTPTDKGMEFLSYAKNILSQVDEMETLYKHEKQDKLTFSISVPRTAYIGQAFSNIVSRLDRSKGIELRYNETNNLNAINNVLDDNYNLAMIRCQTSQEKYFVNMLKEKGLSAKSIWEFEFLLLMSKKHPLSHKEDISYDDLSDFIEIAHDDYYVPSLSPSEIRKEELADIIDKRIFVYERASLLNLLSTTPTTYMWAAPLPQDLIDRHSLVQVPFTEPARRYKDILVYRNNYPFTDLDEAFLEELEKSISAVEPAYL
ncbi:MAG TPA: LysR family transcriptional regulator [Bacillota bacterium]|nr:LysR family transcriptional regulator [Bacillota bacterium]